LFCLPCYPRHAYLHPFPTRRSSDLTAITSIALDHEAWLGHDLAAIAMEKAGIVKPGVPLALGRLPDEAARVVVARGQVVPEPGRSEEHTSELQSRGQLV